MVNNALMMPLARKVASLFSAQPLPSLRFGDTRVCDKTEAMLLCLQSPSKTCLDAVAGKDAYKEDDGHGGQWLWHRRVFARCR